MLNSCPACFYKLENEPSLEFDWLVSIDGNNSLKRWDSTIYGATRCTDSRKARSDYWINAHDVDRFKDEVRVQVMCFGLSFTLLLIDNNIQRDTDVDNWKDETAGMDVKTPSSFTCVNRWRNAGPETCKKMFSVFDESGIFIASYLPLASIKLIFPQLSKLIVFQKSFNSLVDKNLCQYWLRIMGKFTHWMK